MAYQRPYPTAHQQWQQQQPSQMPPQQQEAVFVNMPPRSELGVQKLTMPVVMFFGAALLLMGATYAATTQLSDLKFAIKELAAKMDSLAGDMASRIGRVEEDAKERARDRWTKADHEYWCARTEQINDGWRCAENPGQPRREAGRKGLSGNPPIWSGVTVTDGARKR